MVNTKFAIYHARKDCEVYSIHTFTPVTLICRYQAEGLQDLYAIFIIFYQGKNMPTCLQGIKK
jgi:hypothetical protein